MPSIPRVLHQGLAADKPTADATLNQGWLYYETDTGTLQQSWNGVWVPIVIPAGGGVTVSDYVTSDIALASGTTDGPVVTVGAGRWLLHGAVTLKNVSYSQFMRARLWDGTTTFAEAEGVPEHANYAISLALSAVVDPVGSTTYRIACGLADPNSYILAQTPHIAAGNYASYLHATPL